MWIDIRECFFQLRALVRICYLRPNSWREIAIGIIVLLFLPLVLLVCILANTKYSAIATDKRVNGAVSPCHIEKNKHR